MGLFRKLEKLMEKKFEGQDSGVNPHYLEASRAAQRLMLDNKFKIDGQVFIPNLILVPFDKLEEVPNFYIKNLLETIKDSTEAEIYRVLAPFSARIVRSDDGFSEVEATWADQNGKIAAGMIECCEGPLKGAIWGIPLEGAVLGRGKDTYIHIEMDQRLSRYHLRVSVSPDDRIVLEDLGSSNGTFLKNQAIATKKKIISRSGVKVTAGSLSFKCYAFPGQVKRWK